MNSLLRLYWTSSVSRLLIVEIGGFIFHFMLIELLWIYAYWVVSVRFFSFSLITLCPLHPAKPIFISPCMQEALHIRCYFTHIVILDTVESRAFHLMNSPQTVFSRLLFAIMLHLFLSSKAIFTLATFLFSLLRAAPPLTYQHKSLHFRWPLFCPLFYAILHTFYS